MAWNHAILQQTRLVFLLADQRARKRSQFCIFYDCVVGYDGLLGLMGFCSVAGAIGKLFKSILARSAASRVLSRDKVLSFSHHSVDLLAALVALLREVVAGQEVLLPCFEVDVHLL